ncbi:MAG: hypothetical protein COT15_01430 [Candidatus Diapherotrites archaeon CG08_land_8_20_14_0_20_34_12]|nr:MAG: hypothetical protein COT15_01430 [Candidatus Diapherotrites archaeon CG08_land_8_20_14_0_20_34_12]
MASFVAILGKGRGTWGHIARLIQEESFDNILLISNDFGKEHFAPSKQCDWVLINARTGFEVLKNIIKEKLPNGELIISLISGIGKEHTALMAAIKEKGSNYKLVILTGDGTKYY